MRLLFRILLLTVIAIGVMIFLVLDRETSLPDDVIVSAHDVKIAEDIIRQFYNDYQKQLTDVEVVITPVQLKALSKVASYSLNRFHAI